MNPLGKWDGSQIIHAGDLHMLRVTLEGMLSRREANTWTLVRAAQQLDLVESLMTWLENGKQGNIIKAVIKETK